MQKNREILDKWFVEAYNKAIKKGFKRQIRIKAMRNIYLSHYILTITTDRKHEIIWMIERDLMNMEKLCQLISEDKTLSESFFRNNLMRCIIW